MAKRKQRSKRSLTSLPKGLPQRSNHGGSNPFETASRQKRPKQEVHNRPLARKGNQESALARSLQGRKALLNKKSNDFVDRRIGKYTMTPEQQALARIVKERSRQSKRTSKYSLQDDDDTVPMLTHKGRAIDTLTAKDHVFLSDDEEDDGNLEAIDTEFHFGGGSLNVQNHYGASAGNESMTDVYSRRKTELDDLIARRKMLKAERIKNRDTQEEAVETLDESFAELAGMLQFRDKEKEYQNQQKQKREGTLTEEDVEMEDWKKQVKEYLFERKVKATDRTMSAEEIAAQEAERLQQLETRRLARMNGDFEDDNLSDISADESSNPERRRKNNGPSNPDELDDSSEDENDKDELEARFTADGLVYVDKDGKFVKKMGEEESSDGQQDHSSSLSSDESEVSGGVEMANLGVLQKGARVKGNYHAKEQFEERAHWYEGVVSEVHKHQDGTVTYDVTYDDGDFEYDMEPENVRPIAKSKDERKQEHEEKNRDLVQRMKRNKAKEKARQEIPFVFEVPTTLEALHDMISTWALTGADASLIIQRIHKANSVRLDKRNASKMQNFYDVLLRRYTAVGDAIHLSGNGGEDLGRYKQLDALTQTLYAMAQDSPECAAAVWGRRLGIFFSAHAKRLRDAEFVRAQDDEQESAWPSTGTFLLLRALGHVFPVTDQRHPVVTPTLLFLGQILAQTPVRSVHDLKMGVLFAGLMLEYTKNAKRIAPEALGFLAGVIRLFGVSPQARNDDTFAVPSLEATSKLDMFRSLRRNISQNHAETKEEVMLYISLEKDCVDESCSSMGIICSSLNIVKHSVYHLSGSLENGEPEAFYEVYRSISLLKPKAKDNALPDKVADLALETEKAVYDACKMGTARTPLKRRVGPSVTDLAVKSLAPRMEDPSRYSLSKDKGKSAKQSALDRARREYKREHKAISRELRLDAAFIENGRRQDKARRDDAERAKRHANFAWLEGEQAAMNQQVRQGGGLLSGGGTGAARAKVKSAQMGIKKGGKFR